MAKSPAIPKGPITSDQDQAVAEVIQPPEQPAEIPSEPVPEVIEPTAEQIPEVIAPSVPDPNICLVTTVYGWPIRILGQDAVARPGMKTPVVLTPWVQAQIKGRILKKC